MCVRMVCWLWRHVERRRPESFNSPSISSAWTLNSDSTLLTRLSHPIAFFVSMGRYGSPSPLRYNYGMGMDG